MPPVQLTNPAVPEREQRGIALPLLLGCIEAIGQQGEGQIPAAAGEVVNLQPLDLFVQVGDIGEGPKKRPVPDTATLRLGRQDGLRSSSTF